VDAHVRQRVTQDFSRTLSHRAHTWCRNVTGVTVVGVRGHLVAVEAHVGRGPPWVTYATCLGGSSTSAFRLPPDNVAGPRTSAEVWSDTRCRYGPSSYMDA
jgi:hypothetical protein